MTKNLDDYKKAELAIFWFRRDLRLNDNAGLYEALSNSDSVLPLFIFDSEILERLPGNEDKRVVFIHKAILKLQNELLKVGFSNELIWREFFMMILYHYPYVANECFKKKYNYIVWRNNEEEFEKWCFGETGYPIVDAGMRELNETGFMHNRVRMIVASFLTKHLLIDWRWGEAYFAEKLLDFELSSNNGNWQWSVGCGCDSAPYFRVFNPHEQIKKYDANLIYTQKWVKNFNKSDYPTPIVEHKCARERFLKLHKTTLENYIL